MDIGLLQGIVEAHEAGATRDEICGRVLDHYDAADAEALAGVVEGSNPRLAGMEDALRQTLQAHRAGLDAISAFPLVPLIEAVAVACVLEIAGEDCGPGAAGVAPTQGSERGNGVEELVCLVGCLEAHLYNPREENTQAAAYYAEIHWHRLAHLRQVRGTRMGTLRCFLLLDLVVIMPRAQREQHSA